MELTIPNLSLSLRYKILLGKESSEPELSSPHVYSARVLINLPRPGQHQQGLPRERLHGGTLCTQRHCACPQHRL